MIYKPVRNTGIRDVLKFGTIFNGGSATVDLACDGASVLGVDTDGNIDHYELINLNRSSAGESEEFIQAEKSRMQARLGNILKLTSQAARGKVNEQSFEDLFVTMSFVPLVGTADKIAQGELWEAGISFGDDIVTVLSLGTSKGVSTSLKIACNGVKRLHAAAATVKATTAFMRAFEGIRDIANGNYTDGILHVGEGFLRLLGASDSLIQRLKTACFVAGTPVATEHGSRPIEQIRSGDRVWARDLATGEGVLRSVVQTHVNVVNDRFVTIRFGNDSIESTSGHPYWVIEGDNLEDRRFETLDHECKPSNMIRGRWVQAIDLRPGDLLLMSTGKTDLVSSLIVAEKIDTVYNFEVEDCHNYSVGHAGVLVHNGGGAAFGKSCFEAAKRAQSKILGQWKNVIESMSARARAYQKQITGRDGKAYFVKGVKFDGVANGVLIDAKGPGYATFVKNGRFLDWFKGAEELTKQAQNQLRAANGTPIRWYVAEAEAAAAIRNMFKDKRITGIEIIHTPIVMK